MECCGTTTYYWFYQYFLGPNKSKLPNSDRKSCQQEKSITVRSMICVQLRHHLDIMHHLALVSLSTCNYVFKDSCRLNSMECCIASVWREGGWLSKMFLRCCCMLFLYWCCLHVVELPTSNVSTKETPRYSSLARFNITTLFQFPLSMQLKGIMQEKTIWTNFGWSL